MQIAGGTGITPMLQVVSEVLRNPEDKTEVSLVFGNVRAIPAVPCDFMWCPCNTGKLSCYEAGFCMLPGE